MRTNKTVWYVLVALMGLLLVIGARSDTRVAKTSAGVNSSGMSSWSVQVDKVDPGDVNLDPAFRIAIYENLVDELDKTKRFNVANKIKGSTLQEPATAMSLRPKPISQLLTRLDS